MSWSLPTSTTKAWRRSSDNRFLEGAEEAATDFLVTGNLRHFPSRWKTTKVVNSRQLLDSFLEQLRLES